MSAAYLLVLLAALTCMALLDRRYRLFFWRRPYRAAIVLAVNTVFFVSWDLAGIALGIFSRGGTAFATGWMLAPEFPVEELLFLIFLGYLTMVLLTGARLIADRRQRR